MANDALFRHSFDVQSSEIDANSHVNNVVYVQWMQDIAIAHSHHCGGLAQLESLGSTWVAQSHHIEYVSPAYEGETITALTWVHSLGRVRSIRRYRFYRDTDSTLLAKGETNWVFVDANKGTPRKIPTEISDLYPLLTEDAEPTSLPEKQ